MDNDVVEVPIELVEEVVANKLVLELDALKKLNMPVLKKELHKRNLKVTSWKTDLIARLMNLTEKGVVAALQIKKKCTAANGSEK